MGQSLLVVLCSNSLDVPLGICVVATCNGGDHAHETNRPTFYLVCYITSSAWAWDSWRVLIGFGSAVAAEPQEKRRPLKWSFAPVPVQGGTPGLGGAYHVFGPMTASPDQEPSTISNFKGFAGYALISGNVTRTNIKTGEQQYLPFTDTDMRFMTGTFKGTDGQKNTRHVCIDSFE